MEKFKLQPTFVNPLRPSVSRRGSGIADKNSHNVLDAKSLVISSSHQPGHRKASVRMLFKMKKPPSFLVSSDSKENIEPRADKKVKIEKPVCSETKTVCSKMDEDFQLKPAPRISPVQTNVFAINLIVFEEKLSKFYV